jgi:hypothetical protein
MPALAASLDDPPSGRAGPVWFDALAYCREKLLSGAPVPWASPGELSAFYAKAQGMFRSDVLLVDLADLYAQRVEQDHALPGAMAARSRPGFALRTLLADEHARAIARDATTAIGAGDATTPMVLSVPSPAGWLAISAEQAGAPAEGPPEPRHVEAAAMYVADLLRVFATARVDGLLLDEGATSDTDVAAYRPVLNVAGNYQWPVWVRTDDAPCWPRARSTAWPGGSGRVRPRSQAARGGPWGRRTEPNHRRQRAPVWCWRSSRQPRTRTRWWMGASADMKGARRCKPQQ